LLQRELLSFKGAAAGTDRFPHTFKTCPPQVDSNLNKQYTGGEADAFSPIFFALQKK